MEGEANGQMSVLSDSYVVIVRCVYACRVWLGVICDELYISLKVARSL